MSWVTNYAHNRNCKIARVLYPTAREESSPGFSQSYFRHSTSQKLSPSYQMKPCCLAVMSANFYCVEKSEKFSGLQRDLNPRPRDTGAML